MTRVIFSTIVAALAALFTTIAVAAEVPTSTTGSITVFVAKKIITMDPGWPTATAVAVRDEDGKILSVGSMQDLEPWLKYAKSYRIETRFEDKILLPGFVEAHGHPILGATAITRPLLNFLPVPNPYTEPFPGVANFDGVIKKLEEYIAVPKTENPLGETVLAWGYDVIAMGGLMLDKNDLDAISKDRPLIVWDNSEHFVFANQKAMDTYLGPDDDLNTVGVERDAEGNLNGQFIGPPAALLILGPALQPLLAEKIALKNMRFLADLSRKNGITTTSDLAHGNLNLPLEDQLTNQFFNKDDYPMRVVVVMDAESVIGDFAGKADLDINNPQQLKQATRMAVEFVQDKQKNNSTDKVFYNGTKFFADDSFLSLGMVMVDPPYIDPNRKGLFITQPQDMVDDWLPWWRAGIQIHVHTNGNGGNQATLEALEGLMRARPLMDHRFTFQHYGMSTPEQARRIASVGGTVSINPYYLYSRSEFNAPYVGSDRAFKAALLKTTLDAGVPISLHSDAPVAVPVPLEEVWIAVNRFGLSGAVHAPEERISVHQALRMVTIDAAYTHRVENVVGSIAPGKFADFAVLEADPYTVAKDRIRDIKVWGTVVGGKVFPAADIKEF